MRPSAWTSRRPIRRPLLLAALLVGPLSGCNGEPAGPRPPTEISPQALQYLETALDLMQAHSVHRKRIDWPAFRQRAVAEAGTAQLPRETYAAIRSALHALGDNHSFFVEPGFVPAPPAGMAIGEPTGEILEGKIGRVVTQAFSGSAADSRAHATRYHEIVRSLDEGGACGWIVDTRVNSGGNMWPMLAGLGPVLGEGEPGAFVDPDGRREVWHYRDGVSGYTRADGTVLRLAEVSGTPYRLRRPGPPVAVLTGGVTASSGEAVVVAFRGRPDTRSFGHPTYGVPTANQAYALPDGARIYLTTAWDSDRNGVVYDGPIPPDQTVSGGSGPDAALQAAVDWLLAHPACAE